LEIKPPCSIVISRIFSPLPITGLGAQSSHWPLALCRLVQLPQNRRGSYAVIGDKATPWRRAQMVAFGEGVRLSALDFLQLMCLHLLVHLCVMVVGMYPTNIEKS
jgi:hypothetical protein